MLLLILYTWKTDASTLYWYLFFGSAIAVSLLIFFGATSEAFENWRQRMVERFDRSKLAAHMHRATPSGRTSARPTFGSRKKKGTT